MAWEARSGLKQVYVNNLIWFASPSKWPGKPVRDGQEELPAFAIGKRGYRIAESDLLAFIEARKKRGKSVSNEK